ncbi:MAG: HTH domain-containing protein [Proteobacteria bacterium]|nr:HTH domain-containing protein [Pseudomonadota bacterium]
MTFTEAALEVLRNVRKPLHYKKITELAIEQNLLSHVGKTPEVTMSSRLATMVKKDRGDAPIVKIRPGVFSLREFADETSPDESVKEPEAAGAEPAPQVDAAPAGPEPPGSDLFPQEEDDDEPILAALGEDGERRDSKRRRRRRRRRGRGATTTGPEAESAAQDEPANGAEAPEEPGLSQEPEDADLLGRELADAVFSVLARGSRQPATFKRAAELLVERGRLGGSPAALASTVAASLRADNANRLRSTMPARFRIQGDRLTLTDWHLGSELVGAQEAVERAAVRQREVARRLFVNKLCDLPLTGFAEFIATWLNAEGVASLRAVRRPGSSTNELHFAGTLRRGSEERRLALVVRRDRREITRELVIEARGALHHYGNAGGAWLVTTGQLSSGAREEASSMGAAPVALFDGDALVQAMEALGIGVRLHSVRLTNIDLDFFEALGDSATLARPPRGMRERETRERESDRRNRRGRREGRARRKDAEWEAPVGDDHARQGESKTLDGELESAENNRKTKVETERAAATSEGSQHAEEKVALSDPDAVTKAPLAAQAPMPSTPAEMAVDSSTESQSERSSRVPTAQLDTPAPLLQGTPEPAVAEASREAGAEIKAGTEIKAGAEDDKTKPGAPPPSPDHADGESAGPDAAAVETATGAAATVEPDNRTVASDNRTVASDNRTVASDNRQD